MRISKIFNGCSDDTDVIIIYNRGEPVADLNFYYVTGLVHGGLFEGSYALVFRDGVKIITSKLEEQSASKGIGEVHIFSTAAERDELLRKLVGDAEKIGLNFSGITHGDFEKIKTLLGEREFVDVSAALLNARMTKDESEIKIIREAAKIASEVAEIMPEFMKEGIREYELAARLVYELLKRGAEDSAFTPIVAFGENSAEPHYFSGPRKLKRGDFVLLDFGARYKRYNSDITRTFVFGRASDEQREIYETVLNAQKLGIEKIKSGMNGRDVDAAVRNLIDSTKYKGRFIHSTGHGLGLAVHDHVGLTSSHDLLLKEGMVLTVEPGIYIPGFGGVRIEDDVVVRKDHAEVLTTAPKDLIEI